jgi:Tol biopolymer transport system component/predicted Ser/Thr protein kinase
MICPHCHLENASDSLFCRQCGTRFDRPPDGPSSTRTLEVAAGDLSLGAVFAGRYEIIEELGIGGMGRVYRARDVKLDEEIALKLIKPEIAAEPTTVERFRTEIKIARRITHKNVCRVYDLHEEARRLFLSMEYVPGEDLKSLVRRKGRLSVEEAVSIVKQVCEGLAEAHKLGVVHRDLKPQNIMIDEGGRAKVMDFGIARFVEAPGLTVTGIMIGTPDYMSPEQAEGRDADQRADLYAVGVILFEMVTGDIPFHGDTAFSVALKRRSEAPPDPGRLNPAIPEGLRRLILACMEKDREKRYQTSEELLSDIRKIEAGLPVRKRASPPLRKKLGEALRAVKWTTVLAGGGGALLLAAGLLWVWPRVRGMPEPSLTIGQVTQVTSEDGTETSPSLSPEGNLIAYAASGEIYLRRVGAENPVLLTEDMSLEAAEPAFSPDGRMIAFSARLDGADVRGGIWLMEVMGASKRRLTDAGFSPAWSPDGREIAYATEIPTPYDRPRHSRGSIVDLASGRIREIVTGGPREDMMEPAWSPSGRRLAYWALVGVANRDILTLPVGGGEATPVTSDEFVDWCPVWSRDGRFLFFCSDRSGSPNVWRVRIDEETGRVLGAPEPLTTPAASVMRFDFAADGKSIAYEASDLEANAHRIAFDPAAGAVRGSPVALTSGSRVWMDVDVSVDGRLALRSAMRQEDIYVADADGTHLTPLAPDPGNDRFPRWSPDGTRIAFSSTKGDGGYEIHSIRADGLDLRRHTDFQAAVHFPLWSPDGRRLAFTEYVTAGGRTYVIDIDGPRAKEPLTPLLTPPEPLDLRYRPWSWSPDGRRFAAYSQRGAGMIVYDAATGAHERISDLGEKPRWLGDSRRLVYIHDGALRLIDTLTKTSREIYRPPAGAISDLAVARDDRAIYFILRRDEGNVWIATLK